MTNKFLVSVADVIGRNATTGALLFRGVANINSAFTMATQKTDVRGGINNPLLYTYYHDREVSVSIESATFEKSLLALNAGTSVSNGTITVAKQESVTLSSGSGTLTKTPTSTTVGVLLSDGTIQDVTPTANTIYVAGGGNQSVTAIYDYNETLVDYVTGFATLPPTGIELIMTSEVRDSTNTKIYDFQVIIPNFNISGNYTMALAANGVSTQKIEGTALVKSSSTGDYYYIAKWIPSTAGTVSYTDIAVTPATISFSYASRPQTQQLTAYGIRGGLYANTNVTASGSFARTSGCSTITASASGLVTSTSAVKQGDNAVISFWYWDSVTGSKVDTSSAFVGA